MRYYTSVGIQIPQILLPKTASNLTQWAVIACDQFTSQPEYWQQVADRVGSAPSTYNLILPEVLLGTPAEQERIVSTQKAMQAYVSNGLLVPSEGMLLVERRVDGKTRHGLMLALDLEKYDYNKGSQTLIRATEGTILDRLPPRIRIRQDATLELPHILVLVDDPGFTVIEPLLEECEHLSKAYDFDLMMDSGHLTGYYIDQPALERQVITALEKLASPTTFRAKYGVGEDKGVLLFAMGDGNHSLATAKAIWEKLKPQVGLDHPARYALVEIENVHDRGLSFEPIHRVLFEVQEDYHTALQKYFGSRYSYQPVSGKADMESAVNQQTGKAQRMGVVQGQQFGVITIENPPSNLPVGTLQAFLDAWITQGGAGKIDYVHGSDVVASLACQPGHLGFFLPAMSKSDLFKTVILDGALPRKTFSMGEAHEKRFYMECRRITTG